MGKIHELSNLLANQIAAGEVIERPASVVKELVENAIDAGATQIDIVVENAGETFIRVVDNGAGIDPVDVPLAFTRHATSKITDRHDLFNIVSLGFRGEALPSIAAIADVELRTKTPETTTGLNYHIKGGKEISATPANGRRGTVITVRDLFYNTPARLKYLKKHQTELSKIVDIINRLALSYTGIAFTVSADGRSLLRTTGNGNQQQVIAGIYGRDNAQKMLAIAGENDDFNITGFISLPELTRGSREYLTVLVNGRYIKNFAVSNAVIRGYGSKLMVGRFPMGVININTNPLLIDVNVHPQKSEIRLSKETELAELLVTTIKNRLAEENLIPDAYETLYGQQNKQQNTQNTFTPKAPWIAAEDSMDGHNAEKMSSQPIRRSPSLVTPVEITKREELSSDRVLTFTQKYTNELPQPVFETDNVVEQQVTEPTVTYQSQYSETGSHSQETLPLSEQKPTGFPALDYIGQMHGTFLFAQSEDSFFLIDQHAAQERVNYEFYREQIGQVTNDQQRLLVPITIDYSVSEMLAIADHQPELMALGLRLEPFGATTMIIREHPTWFEKGQEEETVREMTDWLLRDGQLTVAQFREKAAIMMSCKRAIRANMHLSDTAARQLLAHLSMAGNPYNCPHGRPVLTQFTLTEMEKMFKRIQESHEKWESYDNHPF